VGTIRRTGTILVMAGVFCGGGLTDARSALGQEQGAAGQARGQEGSTSGQGAVPEYAIGGVVVDTTTGRPVAHALVDLWIEARAGGGQPPPSRKVMTDDEGRFEIRGLTMMGRGGIQASKPGYHAAGQVRTGLGKSVGAFQELTIEPGAEVTVKLTPEATVAGRVVDESGEPIEGLPVHLTFEGALEGRRILEERPTEVETDEEGEFRFASLPSGRYYVSAGPSEEVASGKSEKGRTSLGYAVMFYGGGVEPATASPIDLNAGKHAEVDLRMGLQPLFRVSGSIRGGLAGQRLEAWVYNAANQRVLDSIQEKADGEFELAELPAGTYSIHVQSVDSGTQECTATVRRLNVTRDVSGLQFALTPCATISVNVHAEHTKTDTSKRSNLMDENGVVRSNLGYLSQVYLRPKDERGNFPSYYARPLKDDPGKAVVRGVEPGRYSLDLPMMRGVYIESMRSAMTDLLREDLVVAPGAAVAPIEVRVRDDAATLDGKVKLDPDVNAAAVIAIPEDMPNRAKTTIVTAGRFQFPPLAPGKYQVLAVDRLDDFAYAEPDVIGKYAAHSKEVTLRANEQTTVELVFVRVGQEEQQ
jgi:hypothetical protein